MHQVELKNPEQENQSQESIASDAQTNSGDEDTKSTLDRELRNRSLLCKPKRFEDHIMEAESFINDDNNPHTYEEAVSSKQSTNWKKAMDREIGSLKETRPGS